MSLRSIKDKIVRRVLCKVIKRHREGIYRFGTPMDKKVTTIYQELSEAQEEALDWINYIEIVKYRMENNMIDLFDCEMVRRRMCNEITRCITDANGDFNALEENLNSLKQKSANELR